MSRQREIRFHGEVRSRPQGHACTLLDAFWSEATRSSLGRADPGVAAVGITRTPLRTTPARTGPAR